MRRAKMIGLFAICYVVAWAASPAFAQPAPAAFDYAALHKFDDPRPTIITAPRVLSPPGPQQASNAYPRRAAHDHVNGRALLECQVSVEGRLTGCKVDWEGPEGYGFGEAALALAPEFVMQPMQRDGAPADGGKVRVPIAFNAFADKPAPPEPPPPPPRPPPYAPFGAGVPAPSELTGIGFPSGRLAALGSTPSGTIWFLSLDDEAWRGRTVEVSLVHVVSLIRWPEGNFNVDRWRLDCDARTAMWLGRRYFDESAQPDGWSRPPENGLPLSLSQKNADSLPVSFAAARLCASSSPGQVVNTADQAMLVTRRLPAR